MVNVESSTGESRLSRALRVLIVEDSPDDAELVELELTNAGYEPDLLRVMSPEAFENALANREWDVITADHAVPGFGAVPALEMLKQSGRDIPFIIVSGTIGDETAVAAMRAGAHDYVLKDNITRLVPAIEREMQEANTRRQKRQAEAALRESEARFRTMYQHAAVGIKQVALDGRLLMVNPALCRMLGYSEAQLRGMTSEEITFPEDRRRETVLVNAALSGEHESFEIEKRYVRSDGSPLWVSVTSSLVEDDAGNPLYRVSIIQDISERKRTEQLEERLRQTQKLEAIGSLAGGIAHDFNTVLNIILGYAELLLAEIPEGDPRRERVQHIATSGNTGALLTKQLLAFSRKQAIVPRVLDLRDALKNLGPMLQRLLGEDVQVEISTASEPCPVKADPGQIQQVVLNLAANARDAMPTGGTLTIETRTVELDAAYVQQHTPMQPGRYEMLAVSDTGIGMDADTTAHLFEPFFTTKSKGKGTGLGLATVYGIVKQSGGDIWVYSEPGVGSTFKVYFPRCPEMIEAPRAVPHEVRNLTGEETILLVEDSKPLRQLTRELLQVGGYNVIEAADGAEALEHARAHEGRIDLLLTDIVMPGMRGTEVASRLQQDRPYTPVVFLSGYTEEAMSHVPGASRVAILEKPFTAESLLRTVREALDNLKLAA